MAMKKILVAARELRGGVPPKDKEGAVERHVARRGDHLTSAVIKKLGLKATDIEALKLSGAIEERDALAPDRDDSDLDLLSGAELEAVLLLRKVAIEPGTDKPGLIALIKTSKAG
ncbi:hypothetical protein NUH86_01730 [Sphingobium sp. JS3065]|uniref:hypothetical protein n=1 Tax=Sphingobium sp. JS3065 TaxID=2970925 RepID=UPI0022648E96|nr:hypothetical protein [Sphingobium sp. JS3065]UZW55551.1 hypothetical protein NUH86_01730 [Sphingobium sp. JS3065]